MALTSRTNAINIVATLVHNEKESIDWLVISIRAQVTVTRGFLEQMMTVVLFVISALISSENKRLNGGSCCSRGEFQRIQYSGVSDKKCRTEGRRRAQCRFRICVRATLNVLIWILLRAQKDSAYGGVKCPTEEGKVAGKPASAQPSKTKTIAHLEKKLVNFSQVFLFPIIYDFRNLLVRVVSSAWSSHFYSLWSSSLSALSQGVENCCSSTLRTLWKFIRLWSYKHGWEINIWHIIIGKTLMVVGETKRTRVTPADGRYHRTWRVPERILQGKRFFGRKTRRVYLWAVWTRNFQWTWR